MKQPTQEKAGGIEELFADATFIRAKKGGMMSATPRLARV